MMRYRFGGLIIILEDSRGTFAIDARGQQTKDKHQEGTAHYRDGKGYDN